MEIVCIDHLDASSVLKVPDKPKKPVPLSILELARTGLFKEVRGVDGDKILFQVSGVQLTKIAVFLCEKIEKE